MSLNLAAVVMRRALALKEELGFGWIASAVDPFPDEGNRLRAMSEKIYANCNNIVARNKPFPVYSGGCDHSIYGSATVNMAFRFWHDVTHVKYGLGFSTADELVVAQLQFDEIKACMDIYNQMLFLADTMGQSFYFQQTGGKFPKDQVQFTKWVGSNLSPSSIGLLAATVSRYLKEFPHDALNTSPQAD